VTRSPLHLLHPDNSSTLCGLALRYATLAKRPDLVSCVECAGLAVSQAPAKAKETGRRCKECGALIGNGER
jgi:hypothetical protein